MSKAIIFRNHQNEKIYPCAFYPIGSVYISFSSTNPSTYFGGTWERIKGRFLLSADDSSYKVNNTGGEVTHTLTIDEMPSHNHDFSRGASNKYEHIYISTNGAWNTPSSGSGYGFGAGYMTISNRGGSQAHNNMPPYIVVYMWRRTA